MTDHDIARIHLLGGGLFKIEIDAELDRSQLRALADELIEWADKDALSVTSRQRPRTGAKRPNQRPMSDTDALRKER